MWRASYYGSILALPFSNASYPRKNTTPSESEIGIVNWCSQEKSYNHRNWKISWRLRGLKAKNGAVEMKGKGRRDESRKRELPKHRSLELTFQCIAIFSSIHFSPHRRLRFSHFPSCFLFRPGKERNDLEKFYTVATPLLAIWHRQCIKCTYTRTYQVRERTLRIRACVVHRNTASRWKRNRYLCRICAGWGRRLPARGIALFNKPRRKDVNKAAADK